MINKEDMISVIITVYNVRPYLQMCVESVFAQTFRNLEIILVDDGSTDGSGGLCDALAGQDSRVRVIHQPNSGVAIARNTGLDAVTGDWLYFVDSDDAISPVTLAHLWTACIRTKADVGIGDFIRFSEMEVPQERRENSMETFGTEEGLRRMLMNEGYGHQPWGKLYRRKLWEKLRFTPGLLYEDHELLYDVLMGAEKIVKIEDALYFYRMQEGSIMHSAIREKNLTLVDTAEKVTEKVSRLYPSLRGAAVRLQVVTDMRLLGDILETDYKLFPDVQKRIIDTLRSLRKEFLDNKEVRKVDKLKFRTLMAGKWLFYLMYRASDARKK